MDSMHIPAGSGRKDTPSIIITSSLIKRKKPASRTFVFFSNTLSLPVNLCFPSADQLLTKVVEEPNILTNGISPLRNKPILPNSEQKLNHFRASERTPFLQHYP